MWTYLLKLLIRNSLTINCIAAVKFNYVGFSVGLEDRQNAPCISVMCHQVAVPCTAGEACYFREEAEPSTSSLELKDKQYKYLKFHAYLFQKLVFTEL